MKRISQTLFILFLGLTLTACASKAIDTEKVKELEENKEFEKLVQVKTIEEPPVESPKEAPTNASTKSTKKATKKAVTPQKSKSAPKTSKTSKPPEKKAQMDTPRQPPLEDAEGFVGRRPVNDPFRVGESVTLALTYFNMAAGYMTMEVKPFVEVNGKKAYHFYVSIKSSKVFSYFYAVDDAAETFVDYEELLPPTYEIHVKESKQLKEIKSYFDHKKLEANYWEKKISKEKGEEEKKKTWKIKPFSQNVISAAYYLRTFQLTPGKKLAFRVADAGKNLTFTGEVLRRERIKTEIGEFDTVVMRPKVTIDGVFKPVGDILFWLTDDDRKFIVRIESKIKIGTIVGKLKSIKRE